MKITKAIIPAAGLGTRFLPITKSVPKELLPIMEIPALQYIVEEALCSGISDFHIIANKNKHAIIEYFSQDNELEEHLAQTHKLPLIDSVNTIISQAVFNYIPQPEPLGLGHAILMAKDAIMNNEYCAIMLPDEIMMGTTPALAQLITIAQRYNCSIIAVQEVPQEHVSSYGIIAIKQELEHNVFEVDHLIEKPSQEQAPSTMAIIGRYVVSSHIFSSLETITPGVLNEIQLTDGLVDMMKNGEKVIAYKVDTVRHDIGNSVGWLQANIHHAISSPHTSSKIKDYILKLLQQ